MNIFNSGRIVPERTERKAPSGLPKVVIIVVIIIWALGSTFYSVNEQQNAVISMFGEVVGTKTAGMYMKIPFIQQVHKVDITTHGTGIGYSVNNGQNITDSTDGIMITSDFNLLNIDFYLEYRVSDPVAYLYHSDNPEEILKNIALSSIRSTVVNYTVDEAMTTAKGQIQADVKADMIKELEENDIGLSVMNITIQDSEPPTEQIIQEFKAVETAKQGADTAKNNALKYQNEQIPKAEAEADRIIQEAEASKEARIADAQGQVARFNKMYEEYSKYPLITKKRLYYESMENLLPYSKVIITDGGTDTMLPLESFVTSETKTETTEE